MLEGMDAVTRGSAIVLGSFIVLVLAACAVAVLLQLAAHPAAETDVSELISAAEKAKPETFTYKELVGLPEPVRRYFRYSLRDNQPYVRYASFSARGDFRPAGSTQWSKIDLRGHVFADNPGFVFEAEMRDGLRSPVKLRDTYAHGVGGSSATESSQRTGLGARSTKPLDRACFQRWASESVLLPTALLPSKYVRWKGLGPDSAKAILSDGVNRCEYTFCFNDLGQITRCECSGSYDMIDGRYRQIDLVTYRSEYKQIDGIRIPTRFSTVRIVPGGNREEYWRGTIGDVRYDSFGR